MTEGTLRNTSAVSPSIDSLARSPAPFGDVYFIVQVGIGVIWIERVASSFRPTRRRATRLNRDSNRRRQSRAFCFPISGRRRRQRLTFPSVVTRGPRLTGRLRDLRLNGWTNLGFLFAQALTYNMQ